MGVGAGGHLRAMGHDQHLGVRSQPPQAQAHRVRHSAADALIDLIEDHQRLGPRSPPRQRCLQREREPRQLPPGRDLSELSEGRARVRGDFEGDAVEPLRPCALERQRLTGHPEAGLVQFQRGQFFQDGVR